MPPSAQLKEKWQERDHVEEIIYLRIGVLAYQPYTRAAVWILNGVLLLALGLLIWYGMGLPWAIRRSTSRRRRW